MKNGSSPFFGKGPLEFTGENYFMLLKNISGKNQKAVGLFILSLMLTWAVPGNSWAEDMSCRPKPPYEAPDYVAPLLKSPQSKPQLVDRNDGTILDTGTGLMWARKDSYSDLAQCLNWTDAQKYVEQLKTGGYTDWRVPTIKELATLFDLTQENVLAWDHDPEYPLALDSKFASGAAYWYWSSDCGATALTECCAKTLYFVNGMIKIRRFELCNNGGVRAVRKFQKKESDQK